MTQVPWATGKRVRVLSLSAPVAHLCPRRYERALAEMRRLGFAVTEGGLARSRAGHLVAEPEARAEEFLSAWFDPEVDILWSVIGGMSTHQILEYLPFEALAQRPKLVVGYSDTTTLLLALYARCRIGSIYGPAVMPQFGEAGGIHPYALGGLERVLSSSVAGPVPQTSELIREHLAWDEADTRPRQSECARTRRMVAPGRAEGRLVAANMGAMLTLAGTDYFPDLRGTVLLLEDDEEETVETLERYLTQMRHLGLFGQVAALGFGRVPHQVGLDDEGFIALVRRATRGHDLPIMAGLEFGHVDPIVSLPLGHWATLDADALELSLSGGAWPPLG